MIRAFVMTVLGEDRPGLVDSIARTIADHQGNWLESRMSHLGGHFAGILRVSVPTDNYNALHSALESLQQQGLSFVIHGEGESESLELRDTTSNASFDFVGPDRPGIVRNISHVLARYEVNVEELDTECYSAPMSGETLFHAHVMVRIPEQCDLDSLHAELEKIAHDMMVDLTLEA